MKSQPHSAMNSENTGSIILIKHHVKAQIVIRQEAGDSSDIHHNPCIFGKMLFCS